MKSSFILSLSAALTVRRLSPFLTGGNISPSVNCHQGVWYAVLVSTELRAHPMQTYKWQAVAGAGAGELPRLRVRREMNSVFLPSLVL